jgi:hypothetical protein
MVPRFDKKKALSFDHHNWDYRLGWVMSGQKSASCRQQNRQERNQSPAVIVAYDRLDLSLFGWDPIDPTATKGRAILLSPMLNTVPRQRELHFNRRG